MSELYKKITESEIDYNKLYKPKWNDTSEISFRNYRIKFNGFDEPNYGRLILRFILFKDDIDITKEIVSGSYYCHPILFPFSDIESNFIYIPTENKIVLIDTITHSIHKFDYPEPMGIKNSFFYKNSLIITFRNNYLKINLSNLKVQSIKEDYIDFVYPYENQLLEFKKNFNQIVIRNLDDLSIIGSKEIGINSKELYTSTIVEYERKYLKSQKGYLWSTGHKNIEKSKKAFPIHNWNLAGYNLEELTLDLGTTIPLSNGIMDERRTMWFEVENKYIRINVKVLVANTVYN